MTVVARAAASPTSAMPHVRRDDAADADRERLLEHDDALARWPSAARTASSGNGRKRLDRRRAPIAHALVAQLVDDVLDRAEHRAERDDDRLGVLGAVARARGRPDVAAERRVELARRAAGSASSACICLACAR